MSDELANIGEDGRRFRAFFGVLCFFFTLGLTALLTVAEAPSPLRLVAFIPAWLCMLFLFQARESTCVLLATKGARSIDSEAEVIDDPEMVERLRAKARRIHVKSLVAALFYTLLLLTLSVVVPWRIPLG
jgi:hypothetical protein